MPRRLGTLQADMPADKYSHPHPHPLLPRRLCAPRAGFPGLDRPGSWHTQQKKVKDEVYGRLLHRCISPGRGNPPMLTTALLAPSET